MLRAAAGTESATDRGPLNSTAVWRRWRPLQSMLTATLRRNLASGTILIHFISLHSVIPLVEPDVFKS